MNIPDGTTPEGIDDVLQHYADQKGYLQRVGNDISSNVNQAANIITNPNIDPLSSAVQASSKALNAVYSPMGEAVKSGYNSLPSAITQPINNAATGASQAVQGAYNSGVNSLSNTSAGQAIGNYLMNSPNAQKGMQTASDDAKAVGNLLTLAPVGKAVESATKVVGDPLYDSAKQSYVQDLVKPKATPTQAAENAMNTTQEGGTNIYEPPANEVKMAQAVSNVDGVSPLNSYQKNLDLVQNAHLQAAQDLKSDVAANNGPISISDLMDKFDNVQKGLEANPALVGDSKAAADKISDLALQHVQNNTMDASGMLQARKDFDAAVQGYKPKIFTSDVGSAMQDATLGYRKAMNEMVADAAPNVDVAGSLANQSTLRSAADNIAPKAAAEASTRMGRALQAVSPHTMTGLGGGLAVDIAAHMGVPPAYLGGIVGAAGLAKAAQSPVTGAALGKLLGGGQ